MRGNVKKKRIARTHYTACDGSMACESVEVDTIEANSCDGISSCYEAKGEYIESRSCDGDYACLRSRFHIIGTGSCIGSNACHGLFNANIGSGSCTEEQSCYNLRGRVGKDACTSGPNACEHYNGYIPDYCPSKEDKHAGNCAKTLLYNGNMDGLMTQGSIWVEGTDGGGIYLESQGTGYYLTHDNTGLEDQNFRMTIVLKISNLYKSLAAISFRNEMGLRDISEGTLVFSSMNKGLFVKGGALFAFVGTYVSTHPFHYGIKDDKEFHVEIKRDDTGFYVYYNGALAYTNFDFDKKIGQVALRPSHSTMKVYAWTLEYL